MKKIIISLMFLMAGSFMFACTYSEETHVLKECKEYMENTSTVLEECKDAHARYNKFVASELGKKAKNAATRAGNKISKFLGDKLSEEAAESNSDEKNKSGKNK